MPASAARIEPARILPINTMAVVAAESDVDLGDESRIIVLFVERGFQPNDIADGFEPAVDKARVLRAQMDAEFLSVRDAAWLMALVAPLLFVADAALALEPVWTARDLVAWSFGGLFVLAAAALVIATFVTAMKQRRKAQRAAGFYGENFLVGWGAFDRWHQRLVRRQTRELAERYLAGRQQ